MTWHDDERNRHVTDQAATALPATGYGVAVAHVDKAVTACRRLLKALDARDAAIRDRDAALRGMVEDGVAKARIGPTLRKRLQAAGISDEDVARLGVSDGNIRLALDRPRT